MRPLRCSARVSSRIARRDTTMLPRRRSIFKIWNGCGMSISGPTSRTGRMSTCDAGKEGDGAAEVDGEAALDPAEDHALDAVAGLEFLLELVPRGFAARAVARQHRFARLNSRPGRHRPRPRRRPSIRPSGPAPRTRAARPGLRDFRPTSITAMSFSIAVTMPFTTLPSKVSFSPPRLSLSSAAKSSRVGNVVVAMRGVVFRNQIGPAAWPPPWRAFTCGPGQMHCRAEPIRARRPLAAVHAKKRVPVPA